MDSGVPRSREFDRPISTERPQATALINRRKRQLSTNSSATLRFDSREPGKTHHLSPVFVRVIQLSGARASYPRYPRIVAAHQIDLHLVSDATGETLNSIARATTAQFEHVQIVYHRWSLIRTRFQLHRVLEGIEASPARCSPPWSKRRCAASSTRPASG